MAQPFTRLSLSGRSQGRADISQKRRTISGRAAAGILYAALSLPPFLFGSREPATVAAWCALLGAGLVIAPLKRLERGHWFALGSLAFVVLCFAFVLHEQLAEHPWVAPYNSIWDRASKALGQDLVPSVSVVRDRPLFALGAPLANMLALLLGLIVGVDSERARRGVRVMAWAGAGYAIYGILASLFDPTEILWREKNAYIGSLTATFINRNTAASYFGSCAAVWLMLLMAAVRRRLPRGPIEWKRMPYHLLVNIRRDMVIRCAMLFVCLTAMFMTNSRGGTLVSILIMMIGFVLYFGRDMSWRGLAAALAGSAVMGLVLLQVFGGRIGHRIDLLGLSDSSRLSAYRSMIPMIADNPGFGTGLGTFASVFPAYRPDDVSMQGVWSKGHSTPLEFALEMGLPLTAIVVAAWAAAFAVLLRTVRGRRMKMTVPLSALLVSMIALAHSSIDFSLQIVGYSIVVFALLGLGLSQALSKASFNFPASASDERGTAS